MTPEIRALILYAYMLGGNTRDMARFTNIPHDEITDALLKGAHEEAILAIQDWAAIKSMCVGCTSAEIMQGHRLNCPDRIE